MAQTRSHALDEADWVDDNDAVDEDDADDDDLLDDDDLPDDDDGAVDELDQTDDWTATGLQPNTHSNSRSTAVPTFQPASNWRSSATEAALCVALGAPFDYAALAFKEIGFLRRTSHALAVQLREWGERCTSLTIDGSDDALRRFDERKIRGLATWFPKLVEGVEGDERFTLKFVPPKPRQGPLLQARKLVSFDLPGMRALGGMTNLGDLELSGCEVANSREILQTRDRAQFVEAVAVAISSLPRLSTFRAWRWTEYYSVQVQDDLLTALHGKRPALLLNRGVCDVCLAEGEDAEQRIAVLPCSSETCDRSACSSHSLVCAICSGSKCRPCIVHTCSTCDVAVCEECAREYPDQVPAFRSCSYCFDDDEVDEDGRSEQCSMCLENDRTAFWRCSADGCDKICCHDCLDMRDVDDVPQCIDAWNRGCDGRLEFCSDHANDDGCPQCAHRCAACQPEGQCLSCDAVLALRATIATLRTQIQSAGLTPLA